MFKKMLVLGLILAGVFTGVYAVLAADGSNYVDVNSCAQVGKDIRINRAGQNYTLNSSCRNAGHGYRNYKMICVSNKQYKVEWTDGCTPAVTPTPVVVPTPVIVQAPVVNYFKTTINAPLSLFNENGVSWIKIEGNGYADVGISSVEIYLGVSDNKYSQPLVKKCNFSGNDKSASCVLSFPRSLFHGGFYWARVIGKEGSTKDSDLGYYNY